jgi:hypothetical protein
MTLSDEPREHLLSYTFAGDGLIAVQWYKETELLFCQKRMEAGVGGEFGGQSPTTMPWRLECQIMPVMMTSILHP